MAQENGADDESGALDDLDNKSNQNDKKDFVPINQFKAALKNVNDKNLQLQRELDELREKTKPTQVIETKQYTRAELKAAVAAGQITEEQSDEVWSAQIAERVKNEVTKQVLDNVNSGTQKNRVISDLSEYKKLAPEILEDGNEIRMKISGEFNSLIEDGHPNSLETERLAIRMVLGPIEKLRIAKSARLDNENFDHSTGNGAENRNSGKNKTLVDSLTTREKEYYDGMIKKGQYKDWKEVEAELAFASPEVRRKSGARV